MKINTKEKGITLIALIVTIIVLLILAGVTIISLTGENGILGKSSDAKLKREIAKEIEQIKLSVNAVYTSYYDKGYLPVEPLRKELQTSYEGVTSVEETSDIGEATKVSKAKKKVNLGSMFGIESLAVKNEDVEPTQEFAKITYTSKREYYVKIKNITGGNSDPVGTIYSKGGTADDGNDDNVNGNAITYNLNGGTNPEDAPTSYKTGEVIGFPTPTKDGNAFEGWYQTSDFSDERVLRTNDTMSGSITLYAKWAEETDSSYFTWTDGDTTSTVTGFSEEGLAVYNAGNLTKLVIPKKHNNLDVTEIKESAFSGKDKLTEVTISDKVTSVGNSVFSNCTELKEITIPISLNVSHSDNRSSNEWAVFYNCTKINKVNFTKGTGEGFEYYSDSAKHDNMATHHFYTPWYYSRNNEIEVTMEEGITSIGINMFSNCTGLTKLDLPSTVHSIGANAFSECTLWNTNIKLSNLTKIGEKSFYKCENISGEFKISNDIEGIPNYAFYNCEKLTGNIKIPEKLTSIGKYAFYGCAGITGTLEIPSKITSIDEHVFDNCKNIEKVIIPDTVTSLNTNSFGNCTELKEITVPISLNVSNGDNYSSGSAVFYNCTKINKVNFTKGTGEGFEYYADTTNHRGMHPFYTPWHYSRKNDMEVTMEEGITSIGINTFYECEGIEKINFPSTLKSIGERAFYSINSITEINYNGSQEMWNAITIGGNNTVLDNINYRQ